MDVSDCEICTGRIDAPGGVIYKAGGWIVDHCIGPLPVGTLIVKPLRHCESVADLTTPEAESLGPLLKDTTACVRTLTSADQVYVCLWSHAGWRAGHIHFVVQPAWNKDRERFADPGPATQTALFLEGPPLDRDAAAAFAARAELWFRRESHS